jgi:threonine/homoserine/homoserine lactone efflux protein
MPPPDLFLGFIAAVTLLMLLPGPNVMLLVGNSVAHGRSAGFATLAGTASAMAVQLAVTAFGLTALLAHMGAWFGILRWVGVGYLLWIGITTWRRPAADGSPRAAAPPGLRALWSRGFIVSLTNPKTLFFYGALFPQFIDPARPATVQVAVLAGSFLGLALAIDGLWVLLGGALGRRFTAVGRLSNRLGGGLLCGAALGLAIARRP